MRGCIPHQHVTIFCTWKIPPVTSLLREHLALFPLIKYQVPWNYYCREVGRCMYCRLWPVSLAFTAVLAERKDTETEDINFTAEAAAARWVWDNQSTTHRLGRWPWRFVGGAGRGGYNSVWCCCWCRISLVNRLQSSDVFDDGVEWTRVSSAVCQNVHIVRFDLTVSLIWTSLSSKNHGKSWRLVDYVTGCKVRP